MFMNIDKKLDELFGLLDNDENVLDIDVVDTSDSLYKLVSNGVKIEYTSNKDFILFKYKNNNIAIYQKNVYFCQLKKRIEMRKLYNYLLYI